MDNVDICRKALKHYGIEKQTLKALEELGELIQAIAKGDTDKISEEWADVEIIMSQLIRFYNLYSQIFRHTEAKLKRLNSRIEAERSRNDG